MTAEDEIRKQIVDGERRFFDIVYEYNLTDFKNKTVDYFLDFFKSNFRYINLYTINHSNFPVYRCRKLILEKTQYVKSDIFYNPETEFISKGRLNDFREQVLYTANNPMTALLESDIRAGDNFLLGLFSAHIDKAVIIGAKTQYYKDTNIRSNSEFYQMAFRNFLLQVINVEIDNDKFMYNPSIALGKYFLQNNQNSALVYPSNKNESNVNIAFKKEIADKYVCPTTLIKAKFDKFLDKENVLISDIQKFEFKPDLNIFVEMKHEKSEQAILCQDNIKTGEKNIDLFSTCYKNPPYNSINDPNLDEMIENVRKFYEAFND